MSSDKVAVGAHADGNVVAHPPAEPADVGGMGVRKITDARAMRALAHPLRLALLEALAHAGTLTATQASELLGESPANCAFHLRTLAKYGYVVEAGGGRGRERPWRRAHTALQISSGQDDPAVAVAAEEVGQFWLDMVLDRARRALSMRGSWPADWHHNDLLGQTEHIVYVTQEEARQLGEQVQRLIRRYDERADHPGRRPAGAIPVEVLLLSYPLLHLSGWQPPAADEAAPG
ncbi:MAG TPA: transcriptional regulator [Actinobacteria bacterium]|nr:transcriptional regulator [Actinomycetota bacterium]